MAAPTRPTLMASPWDVIPPTTTPTRAQPKRRPGGLPVALSGPVPPWQGEAPEIRDPALPRVLPAPVAPPETRDPVLPRPVPSGPGQSALPPPIVDPTGVPGDPSIGPRLDPIELPGGDQGAQMAGEIAASIRALLQGRGGRAGRRISAR